MAEETADVLECPNCQNVIDLDDIGNVSSYNCPKCGVEIEFVDEDDEAEEVDEINPMTLLEDDEDEEVEDEEVEDDDVEDDEAEEVEIEEKPAKKSKKEEKKADKKEEKKEEKKEKKADKKEDAKPKKVGGARNPRKKDPDEIDKYFQFIKKQTKGVNAPMVSEHFGVTESFARNMIRVALQHATSLGLKADKTYVTIDADGKSKRIKVYKIEGGK